MMAALAPVIAWVGAHAGTIGTVAAATGTAVSAYGSIQAGRQAEETAKFNAALEAQKARAEMESAAYEEKQSRRERSRLLSRQAALYGKAGVKMEGSPLDVMAETAAEGELEALMIRKYGATKAQQAMSQAQIDRYMGRTARTTGYMRAGTTLLTEGGSLLKGL
jgi:hypothetical protein